MWAGNCTLKSHLAEWHVRPWSTGSRFWRAGGEWFSFNRKSLWVAGQQGMSPAFRWPSLTDGASQIGSKGPVRAKLLSASHKLGP
jgi:hypothetical protein